MRACVRACEAITRASLPRKTKNKERSKGTSDSHPSAKMCHSRRPSTVGPLERRPQSGRVIHVYFCVVGFGKVVELFARAGPAMGKESKGEAMCRIAGRRGRQACVRLFVFRPARNVPMSILYVREIVVVVSV